VQRMMRKTRSIAVNDEGAGDVPAALCYIRSLVSLLVGARTPDNRTLLGRTRRDTDPTKIWMSQGASRDGEGARAMRKGNRPIAEERDAKKATAWKPQAEVEEIRRIVGTNSKACNGGTVVSRRPFVPIDRRKAGPRFQTEMPLPIEGNKPAKPQRRKDVDQAKPASIGSAARVLLFGKWLESAASQKRIGLRLI